MNFNEEYTLAIENLFKRHQSVSKAGFTNDAYKPGLDAMLALDNATGNPSRSFRSIHVAGTNGKGSVCSMLAASLAAAGKKTGLYTSPHLVDFRERIKIVADGSFEMISREEVMEYISTAPIGNLTFFEVTTGMAFWWFAKRKVDIAVVEVGLGGRLDSTNIITPEVSVVTSIGLDHCAILGDTRAEIAAEKAGIFKKGVPAVVWGRDEETAPVFIAKAEETGSELHFALEEVAPGPINLPTVLKTLSLLGLKADSKALEHHCRITGFHGRWETLGPGMICDIGHNPAALKINFDRLEGLGKPMLIVYGVMADKDYRTNIGLIPTGAEIFLCAPRTPRALPLEELAAAVAELRPELRSKTFGSVSEAVRAASARASELTDSVIFICGSTFVVSEAVQTI